MMNAPLMTMLNVAFAFTRMSVEEHFLSFPHAHSLCNKGELRLNADFYPHLSLRTTIEAERAHIYSPFPLQGSNVKMTFGS